MPENTAKFRKSRLRVLSEDARALIHKRLLAMYEEELRQNKVDYSPHTNRLYTFSNNYKASKMGVDIKTSQKMLNGGGVQENQCRIVFERLKLDWHENYWTRLQVKESNLDGIALRQTLRITPKPTTRLVGREEEVCQIQNKLVAARLVTLTGTGGVGKTRLAIEVANQADDHYNIVCFVELANLEQDSSLVAATIASTLGVKEQPGQPIKDTLLEFLEPNAALLVLDNCEHLLQPCADLAGTLLNGCENLQILATSREPMGITGEVRHSAPPLSLPEAKQTSGETDIISRLLKYEAIQLFVERAQAVRSDFRFTVQNASSVEQICRRLDGIALAIELAAARVEALSTDEILARLDDRFRLLAKGDRTALPRHQTLRALIDWSYGLLNEQEQALFCRLSIFAGGWTLEAAESVGSLVAKSLVRVEGEQAERPARYYLLETLRQYGRERLDEKGETAAVGRRYRDCFLALAEAASVHWNSEKETIWLQRLNAENENLRATLNGCLEAGEAQVAQQFCCVLDPFWQIRGDFTEGRMWFKWALEAAGGQERTALRAEALRCAGRFARFQSDATLAGTLCEESLAIWQELEDERGITLARMNLGNVILGLHRFTEATSLLEASLATFRVLEDRPRIAQALQSLGLMAREQGDYRTVSRRFTESLTIQRELKDRRGIASSLYNLGENARNWGDYATSRMYCEQSLSLFRELGDKPGLATVLNQLGDLFMILGDYDAAAQPYQDSLTFYRELGAPHGIAWMLRNVGRLAFAQCRYDAARQALEEALATFPSNGELGVALSLIDLGDVVQEQGELDGARKRFEQSKEILQTLEGRPCVALALNKLGIVDLEQGRLQAARTRFEAALAHSQENEVKPGSVEALYNLGLVELEQGDYATARARFEEARVWFQTVRAKQRMAHALRALGLVDCKQGKFASAENRHRQSLRLFRVLGNPKDISCSLEAFADLAAAEGQWERAAQLWGAAERIRDTLGAPPTPREQEAQDCAVQEARAKAGRDVFARAWEQGGNLDLEQAMALALRSAVIGANRKG